MKYLKTGGVSVAFFGDGALNQGVLYESMNMAALWKLPVVFLVVNNQYGMGTRIDQASACLRFVERAETFGVRGAEVDGMDVEAVYRTASRRCYPSAARGTAPHSSSPTATATTATGERTPAPTARRRKRKVEEEGPRGGAEDDA